MAQYIYRHRCVWRGYLIIQQQTFNEPRPSVECAACGQLYTLSESREQRIYWTKVNNPEAWGGESHSENLEDRPNK